MERIIGVIETCLEESYPGSWRRMAGNELKADHLISGKAAWRIELPTASVRISEVDHLLLVIDAAFPNSQPRVFAPGAGSDFRWPHIEQFGLLCLRPTSIFADVRDRTRVHLADALQLLNYSDADCQSEFEREFVSYWTQQATAVKDGHLILSLVKPGGDTRAIYHHFDSRKGQYVVADNPNELKSWLRNSGLNPKDKDILPASLMVLPRPWIPAKFPRTGADLVGGLPDDILRHSLIPGRKSVFIFEAKTPTGPAFAGVVCTRGPIKALKKKYPRNTNELSVEQIKKWFAGGATERLVVNRVDGPWVHGRDHSLEYLELKARRVAIVGCGSIGAGVAYLLAQAGVGELILIDHDRLNAANASRHPLGIEHLCVNKATGLAKVLARKLPHLAFNFAYIARFEWLLSEQLDKLKEADLIIAAGIDIDGEAALNTWRSSLPCPPAYLSTWAEAYAVGGHAVLLYGQDNLMAQFDADERPTFRLTDWPEESGAVIVEAGCGNVFQPHGAVDLSPTIGMAAGLALDALLEKVPASYRRVWMGNRGDVERFGGVLRAGFDTSNAIQEYVW